MKKVFLTLVAVATMGIANAQLFVGGNLGFGMNSGNNKYTEDGTTVTTNYPKTTEWTVAPKIGFQVNKLSFGAIIELNSEKTITEGKYVKDDKLTEKYFGWGVCPFVRYNAFEYGNFSLFCELQIPITSGQNKTKYENGTNPVVESDGAKEFGFAIQVVPGLNYKLSDHLSFDLYVNLLQLGWGMERSTTETTDPTTKDVDTYKGFGIGIYSLPQHDAIGIGFNYSF